MFEFANLTTNILTAHDLVVLIPTIINFLST